MSNFDDLRQIRETKENTEALAEALARQKEFEERRRQFEAEDRLRRKTIEYARSFDDTVTNVLEDLRQAIYSYPGRVTPVRVTSSSIAEWEIVGKRYDGQSHTPVRVLLMYNEDGEPSHFVVRRENVWIGKEVVSFEPAICGLTREELIRAPKNLHPSHTIGAKPHIIEPTHIEW